MLQRTEEEAMAGYSNQDGKGKQNRTDGGVNLSGSPFVCEVAVDVTSGALVGYTLSYGYGLLEKNGFKGSFADAGIGSAGIGSSPKRAAVSFGVGSFVKCFLKRLRGKDDSINAGVAGCCTALAYSFQVAPQALLQSCLVFGAASFMFDELTKPAQAHPLSLSNSVASAPHAVLPPFTLALPSHLLEGFYTFCKSLPNPKSGAGSQHVDDQN